MRIVITVAVVLVVMLAVALLVAFTGLPNVAASAGMPGVFEWYLNTTAANSITARADDVQVPEEFSEEQLRHGLRHFHTMCVICHGAPGVERSEIGEGLHPLPPSLLSPTKPVELTPQTAFWITKHGIQMTGMPGFGPTHSDEEIWGIVAFMDEMQTMSAEEYRRRVEELGLPLEPMEAMEGGGHGHGGPEPAGGDAAASGSESTAAAGGDEGHEHAAGEGHQN